MLTPKNQKQVLFYIEKGRKLLLEKLEESLAAGEKPKTLRIWFDMPGTENKGQMIFYAPSRAGERFAAQVGVVREDTDRLYSNYMILGDVQEVLAYLRREDIADSWLEALCQLSDKVDDFWD